MFPKWLIPAVLAVGFLGFLDSAYLAIKHYQGVGINCVIFEGCDKVAASVYATIGNIPVATLGVFFYLSIIILAIAYWDTKSRQFLFIAAIMTFFGFAASLWFMYLQIFVIKALCTYCIASFASSTTLFGLGVFVLLKSRKKSDVAPIS